jgi:hypothetical protein
MSLLDLVRHQKHPRDPDRDLAIDQSKLTFKWVLGSGAFGEVWFGTWEALDGTVHKVAIKVLMSTAYGGITGRDRVCYVLFFRCLHDTSCLLLYMHTTIICQRAGWAPL